MRYAPIDPTKVKGPPWVAQEFDAWLEVSEDLPKPWKRKAAIMDLRWWHAALEWGGVARIPGWETLAKRWGWKERPTRTIMAAEAEWAPLTKVSRMSPVRVPYESSMGTDERQESGENVPYESRKSPVSVNARVPSSERETETERDVEHTHTSLSGAGAPPPGKAEQGKVGGDLPAVEVAPTSMPEQGAVGESEVWSAYRCYHPTAKASPPKAAQRLLKAALKEHGAEAVEAVVRWVHESQDRQAAFLRDGGYTGLDNILRAEKLPHRIELAQAWEECQKGKPPAQTPSAAPATKGADYGAIFEALWQRRVERGEVRRPAVLVDGAPPEVEERVKVALSSIGGWSALGMMQVNEKPFRKQDFTKAAAAA